MERDRLSGRVVLVVEDDADDRADLRRLLSSRGAYVVAAIDGRDGLEQLKGVCPDVVLCTLTMRGLSGFEFARQMRQHVRHKGVLLFALTGREVQADLRETWSAGFDGHLVKPLSDAALTIIGRRSSYGSV